MIGMTERTHRQNRADQIEVEDFDFNSGCFQHIGNCRQLIAQQHHRRNMVGRAGQLALQFDPTIRVGAEILDGVAEYLRVADQCEYVVRRIQCAGEQADFLHRTGDAADGDKVTHLERFQHDQERPRREVGQQSAPGCADGDADAGNQCRETGGLDAEVAQDGNDQHNVQGDGDEAADVTHQRWIDLLPAQRALQHASGEADQPTSHNPENNGGKHLESCIGGVLQNQVGILLH
jgi:hypothetical protein